MDNGDLVTTLRNQMKKISKIDFYRTKFKEAGINPEDLRTMDDFTKVPFTDSKEFEREVFEIHPPFGSFFDRKVIRINCTPSNKGLMPVLNTKKDLLLMNKANAKSYAKAGLEEKDILLNTISCHVFAGGLQIQGAAETCGAKSISVGPGETERTLEIIKKFKVNVLYSNPSFAMKLAEKGMPGIKILFAGGEPFSSVKGYKDRVREALGGKTILIDAYALSHSMPTGRECRLENGIHIIDDLVFAEIIDPHTGKRLPDGQRGELVVTQFYKEAMPLFRFRTGDLSLLTHAKCQCGYEATLPNGVFGRVDNMVKIKGVKIYPSQIGLILKSYVNLAESPFKCVVTKKDSGGDHFTLKIKSPFAHDPEILRKHLKEALLIQIDDLQFVNELPAGPIVEDNRWP
jgi:phenylacetate-CoA ligase